MNIAVINLRDIFKYLVRITVIIVLIVIFTRFFSSLNLKAQESAIKDNIGNTTKQISNYSFTQCLDVSLSLMSYSKQGIDTGNIINASSILNLDLGILGMNEPKINEDELATTEDTEQPVNVDVQAEIPPTVEQTNLPEHSNVSFRHSQNTKR